MANHKVLLIDYEPKSIERIVKPLEDAGFTVETATDGLAGIEAFERIQPSLVIIEAMIPKKHGFEVCQEIKKTPRGKRTPVVITTAVYKGRKYRTQALHIYGCDEYVEKPIAEDALVALVRRLIGSDSEPVAVGSTREATVAVAKEAAPAPRPPVVSAPAAASAKARPKATSASAIVGDLTEQEIMDRLDALLPSDPFEGDDESLGSVISSLSKSASSEPAMQSRMDLDPIGHEEEPAAISDDDGVFHLPEDLGDIPLNEDSEPAKPAASDSAQVVSFEPARSRRNRRAAAAEAEAEAAAPARPQPVQPTPKAAPRPETREPIAPRATPISEEPARSASKKSSGGAPLWIWGAVACVVLLAGVYMVWFRQGAPAVDEVHPATSTRETQPEPQSQPQDSAIAEPPSASTDPAARPEETGSSVPVAPVVPAASNTTSRTRPNPGAGANAASVDPKNRPAETRREPTVAPKPVPAAPVVGAVPVETKPQGEPSGAAVASPPPEKKEAEAGDRASPARVPAESDPGPPTAANTVPTDSLALDSPPPPSLATGTLPASKSTPATTLIAEDADIPPVAVSRPLPNYTAKARTLRQEGTVVFRLLIDESGRVVDAQLVRGITGSDLNDASLRAARQWIYRPARKNGSPVKVWKVEEVTFKR